MHLYDAHTHRPHSDPGVTSILSLDIIDPIPSSNSGLHSMGLHPWKISQDQPGTAFIKKLLNYYLEHQQCVAVGEVGLDRVKGDFILQKTFFERLYMTLRNADSPPPLVLHCVKAISDLLAIFSKWPYPASIIFHDFNGNFSEAKQLLSKGNVFFSFGRSLFRKQSKTMALLGKLPAERILIESDDADIDLLKVYQEILTHHSDQFGSMKSLENLIKNNFHDAFPRTL